MPSDAPSKVYKTSRARLTCVMLSDVRSYNLTRETYSDITRTFLGFLRSESAKFGLDFRVAFEVHWFETEQHVGNLKHCIGSADDSPKY